jgi:hypothetical protein
MRGNRPRVHMPRPGDRFVDLLTDRVWVWNGVNWYQEEEQSVSKPAPKPVMSYEQCNTVYQDMLAAHFRLVEQLPSDVAADQYQRLVGMLSAIRVIRGDQLDADVLLDIVEADIRAWKAGKMPALNVQWI